MIYRGSEMTLNLSEFKKVKHLKSKIESGDLYLKDACVYRVSLYNETDDKLVLETTNDELPEISSWTPRKELKQLGFVPCPLLLRGPAFDIFDLKDKPTPESIEALKRYRADNEWVYEKLMIDDIFRYSTFFETRFFIVPEGLAAVDPRLKTGQNIRVCCLFNTLTKQEAKKLYKEFDIDPITYKYAMNFKSWPIIYISERFK
jgi:hypothetical protein